VILGLRILVIRVRDGERAIAFYRDGLGLPVLFAVEGTLTRFQLPDGTLIDLEIRPGVAPRPAPGDRAEASESIVLYCDDFEGTLERVVQFGGSVVNPPYPFQDRRLAFFADPEGHVIGLATPA
jgi:predicted enzyme related to lactoylglutathione lyase